MTAPNTPAMSDDEIIVLASRHGFKHRTEGLSGVASAVKEAIRLTRASDRAAMQEAVDIEAAVEAAAIKWCGEKERETFMDDIIYFRNNWSALPGLCAYVDREIGNRARAALAKLTGGE